MLRVIEDSIVVFEVDGWQVACDVSAGPPVVSHFGPALSDTSLLSLAVLGQRGIPHGSLDVDTPAGVLAEHGSGWMGTPGLAGHRDNGSAWAPRMDVGGIEVDALRAVIECTDAVAGIKAEIVFDAQPRSVRMSVVVHNLGPDSYHLDAALLGVVVPGRATDLLTLGGRWTHEFQQRRTQWVDGVVAFENRRGKTSHERIPAVFAGTAAFANTTGEVWCAALGWSGNATVRAEQHTDGTKVLQLGELLLPGEIRLEAGESYSSPSIELVYSDHGTNGISHALHASIRARDGHPGVDRPRPVVLNTWEAVYFNHDLETLKQLADRGAEVGAERFVLDDGWFHLRRHDRAGLGDWWVDPEVWPNGLEPIVSHVTALGMEFGLWFEPEMVNPDSELYRTHPEWALVPAGYEPVLGRHQLVLDLGRQEVADYLFGQIDAVLANHNISYVKWDMNRDLVHASHDDRAGAHAHVVGTYALIDRLKAAHPHVEIESCSSGGGRADFEILKRTERIWTSDSNDALARQHIQAGASMLFPPEVLGAHIGPPQSHTSGRRHGLSFRAATAFFGHLGIEWNVLTMTDAERERLASVIAVHKQHRALLHGGTTWRLDTGDDATVAFAVVTIACYLFGQQDWIAY